jgi:hypothetical protein
MCFGLWQQQQERYTTPVIVVRSYVGSLLKSPVELTTAAAMKSPAKTTRPLCSASLFRMLLLERVK